MRRALLTLCLLTWAAVYPPGPVAAGYQAELVRAGVDQPDAEATARQRAVRWLHSQQLPDGSFGQRLADGTYSGSAAATADVIYVLALAGEDPGGPAWTIEGHSALDALARLAPDYASADPGQAGKVARAVAIAGRDPRAFGGLNLVKVIQSFYNPATGRYHDQLLYRHTLAMEGLRRAGEQVPAAAFDALLTARLRDGGWFWAFEGQTSDLDTTGRVLQILANDGGMRCAPQLLSSAEYLAAQQAVGGGWGATTPPGPPNADSTALAVSGLRAAGYDLGDVRFARKGRDPMASLLAFQEDTGAFAYIRQTGREEVRLAATIDALTALAPAQEGRRCSAVYLPVRLAQ